MLLYRFLVEGNRIIKAKRYIVFFVLFGALGAIFVSSGIADYKNALKEKDLFVTHERNKIDLYVTYTHYGDYGFRVLYMPGPLRVFFNNSSVFENLYSNVDMTEILNVNSSYKGRNLLQKKGFFKDLAGLFYIFGSLLFMHLGMTSYKSEKYFFRFGNAIIRLVIIDLAFILLIACLYRIPAAFHLEFSGGDQKVFFYFSFFLFCFLNFFYAAGLLIRSLTRKKNLVYIYALAFWFLSVSVIPEIMTIYLKEKSKTLPANETYNILKLEEVMNFERQVQQAIAGVKTLEERNRIYQDMAMTFLKSGYLKNSKIENEINRNIQQVVGKYEKALMIYPTCFYTYQSGEASGNGYKGYVELVNYTLKLRFDFVNYYLKKRYESNDKTIQPFVHGEENIFHAPGSLPRAFPAAVGFTLLYTVIFFSAAALVLKRRTSLLPNIKKPEYTFRKGNTYFILCKNDEYREYLFRHYQADRNTIGIDKVEVEDIDIGVSLSQMVTYFCKLSGVEEKRVWDNLRHFGVEGPEVLAEIQRGPGGLRKKSLEESLYKIYSAVSMAGDHETVVINEFLRGKSREMERYFLDLVAELNARGKIIIYLSCEIFLASLPYKGNIKIDSYKSFKIDPLAVSLR